jgi:hypothetical protein
MCTGWFVTTAFQSEEESSVETAPLDYFARNMMHAYPLSASSQVMYDEESMIDFESAGVLPDAYYTNYWSGGGLYF